jgi:hypothetical protein
VSFQIEKRHTNVINFFVQTQGQLFFKRIFNAFKIYKPVIFNAHQLELQVDNDISITACHSAQFFNMILSEKIIMELKPRVLLITAAQITHLTLL